MNTSFAEEMLDNGELRLSSASGDWLHRAALEIVKKRPEIIGRIGKSSNYEQRIKDERKIMEIAGMEIMLALREAAAHMEGAVEKVEQQEREVA